jgi:diguanylate cyclase (GGDEF)-like protein
MDYGTFFFTNIVTVTVFALCISLLAWHNRTVTGMKWFAGGLLVGLAKMILQGMEGKAPVVITAMVGNELDLVSSVLQMMGLIWFVLRRPYGRKWIFLGTVVALTAYTALFLGRIPFSGNVMNLPNVAVCLASAWVVSKHGRDSFASVSKVTAFILVAEASVMSYRAWLTNVRYMRPWETFNARTDPGWLYSLAALAFLAACMVMCEIWFLVTELEREMAEQARTDPLTGALNRRAMEEAALRETSRSIRHGHRLCMIMLDIDHFKLLNDTRGHAAGDYALQALVRTVKTMLRKQDLLARTGGEEFTILLPDTPVDAGLVAAERVRQAVEALDVPFEEASIKFTVSAGVAQLDPSQGGWENMMRRADSAMYEAKELGRNAVAAVDKL